MFPLLSLINLTDKLILALEQQLWLCYQGYWVWVSWSVWASQLVLHTSLLKKENPIAKALQRETCTSFIAA